MRRARSRRQAGVSLVESLLTLPLVVLLVLAVVQVALILRTRLVLESAAAEAARAGALNNAQPLPFAANMGSLNVLRIGNAALTATTNALTRGSVWQGFVNGLMPLETRGTGAAALARGWLATHRELVGAGCVEYLNPTQQTFLDWGFIETSGENRFLLQIPNDTLRYRKSLRYDFKVRESTTFGTDASTTPMPPDRLLLGAVSGKTPQEANVLHLRVRYGMRLDVPLAGPAILRGWQLARLAAAPARGLDRFEQAMLAQGRLPLSAEGAEGMQTPAHWHPFYMFGPDSDVKGALESIWTGVTVSGSDVFSHVLESPGDVVTSMTAFVRNASGTVFQSLLASGVAPVGRAVGDANAFYPAVWNAAARKLLDRVPNAVSDAP